MFTRILPKNPLQIPFIEMKKKGGYQSPSQKQWQKMICENREYKYVVCHSLDDFIREVDEFLKNAELWDEM